MCLMLLRHLLGESYSRVTNCDQIRFFFFFVLIEKQCTWKNDVTKDKIKILSELKMQVV